MQPVKASAALAFTHEKCSGPGFAAVWAGVSKRRVLASFAMSGGSIAALLQWAAVGAVEPFADSVCSLKRLPLRCAVLELASVLIAQAVAGRSAAGGDAAAPAPVGQRLRHGAAGLAGPVKLRQRGLVISEDICRCASHAKRCGCAL